jgi:hypothetical protein
VRRDRRRAIRLARGYTTDDTGLTRAELPARLAPGEHDGVRPAPGQPRRHYDRSVAGRPLRQAAAYYAWLTATTAILDFGVYRLPVHGWGVVGEQIGGYALMVAPLAIWAPRTFASLAMPWRQALAGVMLVLAALAYEGLRLHIGAAGIGENGLGDLAAGAGEELAFRGFLWDRARICGLPLGWLLMVNVVTFTAWHLISVAAGLSQLSGLASVAVLGLLFSLARLWSGNTGLPALLHAAVDIAGV